MTHYSPSSFTALILAAGCGTRIAGLTEEPKTLLSIAGKTLLDWHFEAFRATKLKSVVMVLGYKKELIQQYLEKNWGKEFSITYVYNEDYKNKGNTYSLYLGLKKVPEHVVMFDGDLVYRPAILDSFLQNSQHNNVLVGPASLDDVECTKTLVDGQNLVRRFVDKRPIRPEELKEFRFAGEAIGVMKFSHLFVKEIIKQSELFFEDPKNIPLNWEFLFNRLFPHFPIHHHYESSDQWIEIDTEEDFQRAKSLFEH